MEKSNIVNKLTRPWIALMLIALVAVAIYSNIYSAPFVFDDIRQIEDKTRIRDLRNYLSPGILLSPRPLGELTLALNYKAGKLKVFGYHLVNVMIHVINGFLAYFLARIIFKRLCNYPTSHQSRSTSVQMMALFTALIFVSHPIQTQAVTYTVQRYTSMAAMFYLASVLSYFYARVAAESRKRKTESSKNSAYAALYVFSFFCAALAFLSKESSASLPVAILLVEFIFFDRSWQGWKRKLVWFTPAFLIMGAFIFYASGLFRGGVQFERLLEDVSFVLRSPGAETSRWIYLCTQFNVLVIYIRLLFLPIGQNLDYMYPLKEGFFDGFTPVAFLFLIGILATGIWNIKKRPVITFGIFWFFITLSVESSGFAISDGVFEHRIYLPMFGFAIVIIYLVFYGIPSKKLLSVWVSVLIVLSLGMATYLRNQIWQDQVSLWSDVVAKSPRNFRAHCNLGFALSRDGQLDKGIKSYLETLRIRPDYADAHNNLGVALAKKGNLKGAFTHFSEALRLRPSHSETITNYGQALMQQGKIKEAAARFLKALRLGPNNAKAHNNLGIALARQGNLTEAQGHFSEALRIEPHNFKICGNLGQAFMLQGNLPKAAHYYSEAVRINPGYAEAHSKLGIVLIRQRDLEGAVEHFTKALELKPGFGEARQGLNWALRLKGSKKPPYQ